MQCAVNQQIWWLEDVRRQEYGYGYYIHEDWVVEVIGDSIHTNEGKVFSALQNVPDFYLFEDIQHDVEDKIICNGFFTSQMKAERASKLLQDISKKPQVTAESAEAKSTYSDSDYVFIVEWVNPRWGWQIRKEEILKLCVEDGHLFLQLKSEFHKGSFTYWTEVPRNMRKHVYDFSRDSGEYRRFFNEDQAVEYKDLANAEETVVAAVVDKDVSDFLPDVLENPVKAEFRQGDEGVLVS